MDTVGAAGAHSLFPPPHSPDFDPIERVFAELEAPSRGAAARAVTDLHQAIRHAFARFTPQGCRDHVTAAGHEDDAAVAT